MSSFDHGSWFRRRFPALARLPVAGRVFRELDSRIAVPLERKLIELRVQRRIDEAHQRLAGGTTTLRIAPAIGQPRMDAWTRLGGRNTDATITIAVTYSVRYALPGAAVWRPGTPFPSVLLASPAELSELAEAPCVAVFVDNARALHAHRVAIARAQACFASNRGLLHLARLYHPLVFQAPDDLELAAALCALPNCPSQPTVTIAATPRRVLFQVDDFRQGGLEQVVSDLIEVLANRDCQVSLLVLGEIGPALEAIRNRGVTIHRLESNTPSAYCVLLERVRPAIINAHYSLFGAAEAASLGIPFVQTMHNSYTWLDDTAVARHRVAARYTTAYVCVSATVAYYSAEVLGLPAEKMVVLPNGVDATRRTLLDEKQRSALRAHFGFSDNDFVVVNVAAISDVKAQLQLVRALAVAKDQHLKLLLIGRSADTAYEHALREETHNLLLDRHVVFAGLRQDVPACLSASDAFALPSFWEGDSLALMEALLAGLPVIASDAGRAAELLDLTGGHLIPLPFTSITDVRADTIHRYFTDDERMVVALANALSSIAAHPNCAVVSPAVRSAVDRRQTYGAYATLFQSLVTKAD